MTHIEVVILYLNQQSHRQWNYCLKICNLPAAQSDPPILSVLCCLHRKPAYRP